MSLLELFCHVDAFCPIFLARCEATLLAHSVQRRRRARSLSLREIMTIRIHFPPSHSRDFKAFYTPYVLVPLSVEFLLSVGVPLCVYLRQCRGTCTDIPFADSTDLTVCHNRRIAQHRVFAGLAERGKTSTGWFFGGKVHFVFNDRGALLECTITPGNGDDRKPVPPMVKRLFGKLFGDKGYLSQKLQTQLRETFRVQLITKLRRNLTNQLMPLTDRWLLRKRASVETIIDPLQHTLAPHASAGVSQIEHSRHRSLASFLINLLCGLIAYCHQPTKPSLHLGDVLALPA